MKNSNSATTTKITKAFSFITLVILALLVFIQKLLPVVGLNVNGPAIKVLEIITYILTLIIIGINAYKFVKNKGKVWNIVFIVAIVIFVAAIVLIWFRG